MTVHVFTGPTLSSSDARSHLDAVFHPPAAQGDVFRVARERPDAIGIIDGYFDTLPAIWHKEILWAIHEKIPVFGSASMGALRAAELAVFGMRGVGAIFEAFKSGALEDDDEVALAHEPESNGYRALSVPMVNIRATVAAATSAGIISEEAAGTFVTLAKSVFYPERSYRRLLADARAAGLHGASEALATWLPSGQVDAKRDDALAMLRAMKDYLAEPHEPAPPRFHFEHTTFWEGLRQSCDDRERGENGAPVTASQSRDLLDELRLHPAELETLRLRAVNRAFARALGEREGGRIAPERLLRAAEDFRADRALLSAGSLQAWLDAHDLDEPTLARLLEDEAFLRWAWRPSDVEHRLVDELKLTESYAVLRDRALRKQETLAKVGLSEPGPSDAGMTREALIDWYFERFAPNAPRDMSRVLREAGLPDEQLFLRVVLRELLYLRLAPDPEGPVPTPGV